MRGSNLGPDRCIPPTSAWICSTPVSRWAWRSTLIAPAWLQPDSTTSPRPATCTTIAWSSWIQGSGSHEPRRRASPPGRPRSNGVTRSTWPVTSTAPSISRLGLRTSLTATPSRSRSPRLGGGRRSAAPLGKTALRSRQASGCSSSGSPARPARRTMPSSPPWWSMWPCERTTARRSPSPTPQDVHVVDGGAGPQPGVVEQRRPLAAALHLHQQREAVLGAQLGPVGAEQPEVQRRPASPRRRAAAAC